jgi:predicted PurR-regulated permease PerM
VAYWAKAAAAVGVTLALLYQVRFVVDILLLLLIAFVLAAGLDPIVERLESRGFSRGRAVAIVYVTGAVVLAATLALVAPAVAGQLTGLSDDIPRYVARAEAQDGWLGDYLARTDAADQVRAFIRDLPQRIGSSFGTVLGLAGQVGATLLAVFTVVILTGYLLASLPRLRRTATIVVPHEHRDRAEAAIDRSVARIGAYVAGNVVTSLVCTVTTIVALMVLRVPFAVPLGVWAGLADLIPIVGPYVGAAPAVIVAFFVSPTLGVLTAAFFLVYQQVENYALVPRVMRNAVHLSPAAVILSTLIGAKLAGFAGALLALPLAATLKVVIVESWLRDRVSEGDPLAREQLGRVRREEREAERSGAQRGTRRGRLLGWVGDRVKV